jgi:hypothetical protein
MLTDYNDYHRCDRKIKLKCHCGKIFWASVDKFRKNEKSRSCHGCGCGKLSKNKLEMLLQNTPEAYYWIGFLFADGCIYRGSSGKNKGRLELSCRLAVKDKEHLEKLANFIGVATQKHQAHAVNGKTYHNVNIFAANRSVIKKIIKKFDFRKQKTYNPPKNLVIKNNDLFTAMFIGFVDGDGHIGKYNNHFKIEIHKAWKKTLQTWMDRIWKISGSKVFNRNMVHPTVRLSKERNKKIFGRPTTNNVCLVEMCNYNFMSFLRRKCDELGLPYMKRKWDRIQEVKNPYEKVDKLQKDILKLVRTGMKVKTVAKTLNTSRSNVYANICKRSNLFWNKGTQRYIEASN